LNLSSLLPHFFLAFLDRHQSESPIVINRNPRSSSSESVIDIVRITHIEPEGVLEQENFYTKLLISAQTYQFADQELHLFDERETLILRFQPRQEFDVSPEAFANKTWQLTTATALDTDDLSEFTLSIGESSFSGTTVCRDYDGRYQAEADTFQITFMSMTTEYNCNKKDGNTEAQYTTLLSNVEQYNVTEDHLELFTRHGEKMIFELISKSQ
jgi:heat shock protein HslJ